MQARTGREADAAPGGADLSLPPGGAFIGRARELRELLSGLADAAAGRSRLFLVTGESGIGRTRLVEEFAHRAGRYGARCVWGHAWDGAGVPAFWPWMQIVREIGDSDDPATAAVPVPDLSRDGHGQGGEEIADFALFDAMVSFLRSAAERQPVVCILDDLQAAHRQSLLLLQFLARELTTARVLILGAYPDDAVRPDPSRMQLLREIGRVGGRLPLGPLSTPELAALVEDIAGFAPPADVIATIEDATGGNPFLITELVHMLLAGGQMQPGRPLRSRELDIPDAVEARIRERVAALPERARAVLTDAATLGRRFSATAVADISAKEHGAVVEALERAALDGLVARSTGATDRYRFAQGLTREVVYRTLSPQVRIDLHRSAAAMLEKHYGEHPEHVEEVGYHFLRGGPSEKAVHYGRLSAAAARGKHDYDRAAEIYRDTLEHLETGPVDDAQLCDLLLDLGDCLWRSGRRLDARTTVRRAVDIARMIGSDHQLGRAALVLGGGRVEPGQADRELIALLEHVCDLVGDDDPVLRSRVLGRLAVALYFTDEVDRRTALARQAVETAVATGDPTVLAAALGASHFATWAPDNAQERLGTAMEIVRLARETGHAELILEGQTWAVIDLIELGRIEAAWEQLVDYTMAAERLGMPLYRWYALLFQTTRATLEGRLEDAERLALDALRVGDRAEIGSAGQFYGAQLCVIRGEQGRLDDMAAIADAAARMFPALPAWRCGHAWILTELGRMEEARRQVDALAADDFAALPRDGNWLAAVALLARACAALGDADRSAVLHGLLSPYADRWATIATGVACFGSVSFFLGLSASTAGAADAAGHLEDALAANGPQAPLWAARTAHQLGELLLSRAEPDDHLRGRALLERAEATQRSMRSELRREGSTEAARTQRSDPEPRGEAAADTVFRREGEYWTIRYDGVTTRMRDSKGLRLIAHLLAHPGRQFYVGDLALLGTAPGPSRQPGDIDASRMSVGGLGDAGEMIDTRARDAYRRRLEELQEELEEARRFSDVDRASRIATEIDFLGGELASGVGIGGRPRPAASAAERARLSVTKAIRGAQRRIAEHNPTLGRHLANTVTTGRFCAYSVAPDERVDWVL